MWYEDRARPDPTTAQVSNRARRLARLTPFKTLPAEDLRRKAITQQDLLPSVFWSGLFPQHEEEEEEELVSRCNSHRQEISYRSDNLFQRPIFVTNSRMTSG